MFPRTAVLASVVFLLSACSAPSGACSPETCGGCCDASGVCQPGDGVQQCGGAGLACDVCVGSQVCSEGRCHEGGGVGGGAGGGGAGCVPTTCAAQNKNCGTISDNCGAMLTCGSCTGAQTCGGAGVANLCGAACAMSCPAGFSCNAAGACAGGSPTNLALDVKTVRVSGNITLNGVAPVASGTACAMYPTSPRASVTFVDRAKGYSVEVEIPCSSATTAFTAELFPGNYSVIVEGKDDATNLPTGSFEAKKDFAVTTQLAGQVFDVKSVIVSGTVTLNSGVPANAGTFCNAYPTDAKATVTFSDVAKGTQLRTDVPCSSATFAYSLALFPGTYEVRVDGSSNSNLPDLMYPSRGYLADPAFVVAAPVSGKVLNVQTLAVSGKVTLNGAAPADIGSHCLADPTDTKATVFFIETTRGYQVSAKVPCSSAAFAFNTTLFPGTYEVRVTGSSDSTIPAVSSQVATGFVVSAPLTNQTFDVKPLAVTGNITLNGNTPSDVGTRCSNYPTDTKAIVTFTDAAKKYSISANVPCSSSTYAFSGVLFPGRYEVRVSGSVYSNVPSAGFLAGELVVAGTIPGQVFDVKTLAISGTLTLNGMPPTDVGADCLTSPNDVKASVTFLDKSKGHVITASILCSSATFAFGTAIFPGTYEVRVEGTNRTNLPLSSFQVTAGQQVTTSSSGQVFDVKTVTAAGKVTLNGAVPTNTGSNCAMYPNNVKANVTFTDAVRGYLLTAKVLCGSADFAFNAPIFPGSYEVRVLGTKDSNVPEASFLAVSQLAIQ